MPEIWGAIKVKEKGVNSSHKDPTFENYSISFPDSIHFQPNCCL